MERRFTALRIIGTVLKIIAWLMLILGILAAIGSLIAGFALTDQLGISTLNVGGPLAGIAMFVVVLVVAILQFLAFYAGGEFIYLFLAIEENTRRTAYFMQQQYTARQPAYAPTAVAPDYGD
jgi:hypothetical protein